MPHPKQEFPYAIVHLLNRWELGGVRTHVMDLARAFRDRGMNVRIAAWDGGAQHLARVPFLDLPLYRRGGRSKSVSGFFRSVSILRRFIHESGPTLIHMHSRYVTPLAALAARRLPVSRVYTAHNTFTDLGFLPWYPVPIICPSPSAEAAFRLHVRSAPGHSLALIPHGVRIQTFPAAVTDTVTVPDCPYFLFLGRMTEEKGGDVLIDAAARLTLRGIDNFRVLFLGEGPQRASWERRAKMSGIGRIVDFPGSVDDPRLYLVRAKALVQPSIALDAMPMAVLEAMSVRCLVIASDVPPLRDLVEHGKTGMLAAVRDPDALASCMEEVLKDDDIGGRLVENAHVMARARFSVDRMAEETLAFYRSSCGIGRPISR